MSASLLIAAIILSAASGLPGFLLPGKSRAGQWIATACVVLGCSAGLLASSLGLTGHDSPLILFPWQAMGDSFLGLDRLSAFFLIPVFLVGGLGSIYGLGYWPQNRVELNARRVQVFWGTMISGISILLTAKHGLAFLFGWEMMALSAFFLIAAEDTKSETRKAAWIYLVATHICTLTLFCLFTFWNHATGSFGLNPLAPGTLGLSAMTVVFALTIAGFGLKAGIIPLHFWLPGAHANAPSHVSAMLSGVMLKTGIYGILRMLSLLPEYPVTWGIAVILLGTFSALAGILFALGQDDLKRVLAYSSIENVGIITMGIGIAMIGTSLDQGALVALGMGGALLHVWNHALFKPMLFFASGSILHATGTRKIDLLGGLAKSMPLTAVIFFAGSLAISGLPPLNGFMSELFVYFGLLSPIAGGGTAQALAVAAPILALVGSLAMACFVRLYSTVFSGLPRSDAAMHVHECPSTMLVPMFILMAACMVIGLFPGFLAPVLDGVIYSWVNAAGSTAGMIPPLASIVPFQPLTALSAVLLSLLCAFFLITRAALRKSAKAGTWDCGYSLPGSRMQYSAFSIADSFAAIFSALLRPRAHMPQLKKAFPAPSAMRSELDDPVLDKMILPFSKIVERGSSWFRRFQQGVIQNYILYIFITVVVLLATLIPYARIFAALAGL